MGKRRSLVTRFLGTYVGAMADLPRLTTFHRRLSTWTGFVAVALGLAALIPLMMWSRAALGLPMGEAPLDGIRLQFFCWIAIVLVAIPVCLLGGGVLVGGVLSLVLMVTGRMNREEAIAYTFMSRYPQSWFQERYRGLS